MNLKDLRERVAAGEVCIVESINGEIPEDYILRYPALFAGLTVENDVDKAGILWVYDSSKRDVVHE